MSQWNWATVKSPDNTWANTVSTAGKILIRKLRTQQKTGPSTTLSTTSPIQPNLCISSGLCCEKFATKNLSYGMA
jgi:hypothetical protein